MSVIGDIEQAVIHQLENAGLGVAIEEFPSNPSDYRLIHPVGAVLVAYQRTDIAGAGSATEEHSVRFVLTHLLRNLRKPKGGYDVLEGCSDSLKNFRPLPSGQSESMQLQQERYVSLNDGVWQYDQVYEVKVYHNNGC